MQKHAKKSSSRSEAPLLESFLNLFSSGVVNYCVVCLRTQHERSLVKNKALKDFASALKMDKVWQHNLICHSCMRMATDALKFVKAAKFAAAIDTMFEELMYQKTKAKVNNTMWKDNKFKKTLKKFGLDGVKTTAAEWDKELAEIRKFTEFKETHQPVVKNDNKERTKKRAKTVHNVDPLSSPVYIIPDDPPPSGEVTDAAMSSSSCPVLPVRAQYQRKRKPDNLTTINSNVEMNTDNDSYVLSHQQPNITETLIIFEEDEEQIDQQHAQIAKVVTNTNDPPQPPSQPILNKLLLNNEINSSIPTATPLVTPIQSLLQRPKEIYTGDSLLVGSSGGNYTLHPISIKDGITTIPSLNAKWINNQLIYEIPAAAPLTNTQLENKTLKDLIESPRLMPFLPNDVVLNQTNIPNRLQNNVSTVLHVSESNSSCGVNGDGSNEQSEKRKALPAQIASDNTHTDWEDKIPMDVISYIGAVDPNIDKTLSNYIPPPARPEQHSRPYSNNSDVVIDLG